ncbi:hypothetical protein LZA78_02840 [Sinirhodobacter sp. WL0062]|uniref:DUF429 domain-containing protein n=1 Tax=Rhodobacter flavimaris TaxID=2907145 RepID=A0ABS8YUK5_9RHOB|nr:hypothetical protein [Sinirhodobacter sp. WL0062]MCE5972426.1 hypothetical protein [Sinirhodobacter sp. WL0062]
MRFHRTIGIDYSGAETADSSLPGLRVYMTECGGPAMEVGPPPGPKKYWTRRALAEWLTARLSEPVPTIAGIDHGFSFPDAYFARHGLARDWDFFLDDFHAFWPTDEANTYVEFLRSGRNATGLARLGERSWKRHTEISCKGKSVFHFDVQGQVAKSTHAGLPFLRSLRRALPQLHVWPFDGWDVPVGGSCLVEAYPKLYKDAYPVESRTPDQQDAFSTASWLRDAGTDGRLTKALSPELPADVREMAHYEGWILGVSTAAAPKTSVRSATTSTKRAGLTTVPGYRNPNGQIVIRATGLPGTDHNQQVYQLACEHCGLNYGANGSDIHQRKCPSCGGGRPGLVY